VVLEGDLKREYQSFLQEHNRGRSDSDGRPDRDPREIEEWAHEHDLPYFDDRVHFPDFRIEYELEATAMRISRSSPSTTAARTPPIARGPVSPAMAAGAVVAGGRSILGWRRNFYEFPEPARPQRQRPAGTGQRRRDLRFYQQPPASSGPSDSWRTRAGSPPASALSTHFDDLHIRAARDLRDKPVL
jgi:hypothetical protein